MNLNSRVHSFHCIILSKSTMAETDHVFQAYFSFLLLGEGVVLYFCIISQNLVSPTSPQQLQLCEILPKVYGWLAQCCGYISYSCHHGVTTSGSDSGVSDKILHPVLIHTNVLVLLRKHPGVAFHENLSY